MSTAAAMLSWWEWVGICLAVWIGVGIAFWFLVTRRGRRRSSRVPRRDDW